MSAKIHVTTAHRSLSGRVIKDRKTLTATKVRLAKAEEAIREAERLEGQWFPSFFFQRFTYTNSFS
jgi:hypothetical protein